MYPSLKSFYLSKDYTLWYKLQLLTLVLIAVTLPYSIALNNIAIGLLAAVWLLSGNYLEKLKQAFANRLFILFFAVFLIQVIGLLYTTNMTDGLGKIETKAALVVIPLILASTDRLNRKHVYLIVMAFIVSCTALALYAFFIIFKEYGALDNAAGLTEFIDIAIGLHHAYSGMYLVFAVAAALYLALSGNYRFYSRIVLVLVAVVLYSFLVLLAARTAVFTSFFLFFLFIVYSLVVSKKKQNYLVAGLACVAVLLIVLSLPNTKHKVEEFNKLKGVHNPMTPRLIKWKCCFTILKEQNAWGIGVGTGDVQDHLQQCYADEKFWGDRYLLNAHNEFLEEMVRHGLPGALLLLVSLLYPLWLSIRLNKKLYTVFLVVFIMSSLTESTLSRQKGVVFYALFNSVFAFSCLRSKTVDMLLEKPGQVVV